jgi:predicted Holliday junction resolvase-like endonuclease
LRLSSKYKSAKTWLDKYDSKISSIEKREEKYLEDENDIREKARERGRAMVPNLIKKSMDKRFAKLRYDPYDIKALLHPIDFVVFDGNHQEMLKNIVLMSRKTQNENLLQLHKGISCAVKDRKYDWKVVRVSEDGQVEYE